MPPEIVEESQHAVRRVVDAGGRVAHVAVVDDRHIVLILEFVARDTERSVGEIIASAEA